MRIRSASYERLFNLDDFNNERFRFDADLGEEEDPKNCMAKLAGMVIEIHEVFEVYRNAIEEIRKLQDQLIYYSQRLEQNAQAIDKQEKQIHAMKASEQDEYEIACFVKTLRQLRKQRGEKLKAMKELNEKIAGQKAIRDSIHQRLNDGKLFDAK